MLSRTKAETPPSEPLKEAVAQTVAAAEAAVAADPEMTRLIALRHELVARKAKAEAELAEAARACAAERDARLRQQSIGTEVERLLNGEQPAPVVSLDDAAIQQARRSLEVATQALAQLDVRVRDHRLMHMRKAYQERMAPVLRDIERSVAMSVCQAHGLYCRAYGARDALLRAGFGAVMPVPSWPVHMFGTPNDAFSSGAVFEREAVKAGLLTTEEHAAALGAFTGAVLVTSGQPNFGVPQPAPPKTPEKPAYRFIRVDRRGFRVGVA